MKRKYNIYRCYEGQCIFDKQKEMEEEEANHLALHNEDLVLQLVEREEWKN